MAQLYLLENSSKIVFTYSAVGDGTWRFSRLADCQRAKNAFVMRFKSTDTGSTSPSSSPSPSGWVLEDWATSSNERIGFPYVSLDQPRSQEQSRHSPPLGRWIVWGMNFTLTLTMPTAAPLGSPQSLEVPFATLQYAEEGRVARLEITMHAEPITDDTIEEVLRKMKAILVNLASRPEMVLLIRTDGSDAAVPAMKHVKRYLAFVQENGAEFVLVGRGCAIVLKGRSLIGSTVIGIYKMVQRLLPSPWPETTVSSLEEADAYLAGLEAELPAPEVTWWPVETQSASGLPPIRAAVTDKPAVAVPTQQPAPALQLDAPGERFDSVGTSPAVSPASHPEPCYAAVALGMSMSNVEFEERLKAEIAACQISDGTAEMMPSIRTDGATEMDGTQVRQSTSWLCGYDCIACSK